MNKALALNLFASKPTTVDGVMAAFNNTIADLEAVKAAQEAEATRQAAIASAALDAQIDAQNEAKRADSIVGKMKAIFA